MWPKFPNMCLTVEEKQRKNLNQEIDLTGDRTRVRFVRNNDVTPRPQRTLLLTHLNLIRETRL